jgi:ubiquitin-protein ligase
MSSDINAFIKDITSLITEPINDKIIKLLKYNESISDITFYFEINSYPIKIITDFNKYCLVESEIGNIDNININNFNMSMIFKNKQPKIILEEISRLLDCEKKQLINHFTDPFHIFQEFDEFTKTKVDYSKLEKEFNKLNGQSKLSNIIDKIPKKLLFSPKQISQLIINEIKKVNTNKDYYHYIIPDQSNPYSLILRIKFNIDTQAGYIFSQIKENFGYDYIEIKLNLEPNAHPFIPPKLEYIKPKIKLPLLLGLMNLDILKLENWSSTITLDYLISNLGVQLETIIPNYVIANAPTNSNSNISFNQLEYELIKLASITKESSLEKVNINIIAPKNYSNKLGSDNYWNSGTGYGSDNSQSWDIKSYIKEQELQKEEFTKILSNINKLIDDSNIDIISDSVLISFIINKIKGINMLEVENNRKLFNQIFNIIGSFIGKIQSQNIINTISVSIKSLNEEIDILFKTSEESLKDECILQIYCISDWYLSKYQEPIKKIIVTSDVKEQYCQIMKPLQFGSYELQSFHRFFKYKKNKPNQQALMRILSEISSFKTGLPLNWESTIWVRVPKDNINLFSFLISGPKDTPYENGLFEFHAYFPQEYPNKEPQVLIHTTGNGQVRFNPNLYNSGKVCLSLLGTWQGQEGEKWNAKTSTFLQVMVSIQSLIMVENPYFNEPGWEREMNSISGKQKSNAYNEERQPHTIKFGMTDMIKNPPCGFEDIVKNHFKMKKNEIINNTLIWEQNASNHKNLISINRKELIKVLDKL